ncbi:MAG: choice-of-anchor J domain-containing protein [Chitinophagales bacterium]|nr:choice-of-anchor J domain-containing protein [Bacteroidota bacterium]
MLISLGSIGYQLQAQTVIWSEDFEEFDDFFDNNINADGWSMYDVDGQTPNSGVADFINAWNWVEWDADHGYLMASNSWFTSVVQADKWLATPGIAVDNAGLQFKWKAKAQDPAYPDSYEVVISTVGNSLSDLQSGTVVFSADPEVADWTNRSVSLDDYVGQTIYVGFHNFSTDKYILLVDDFEVAEPTQYELSVSSSSLPIEYAEVPVSQVQEWNNFSTSVNNSGAADQTGVTFSVVISTFDENDEIIEVYNETETADIASGDTYDFSIASGYTPDQANTYIIEYLLHSTEQPDTLSTDFAITLITENEYARAAFYLGDFTDENGDPLVSDFSTSFLSFDGEGPSAGAIGYTFDITTTTTVDSISFLLGPEAAGTITANLYEFDGAVGAKISSTVPYDAIGGQDTGEFAVQALECPASLSPGTYFVAIDDPIDGSAAIVFSNYYFSDGNFYAHTGDGAWFVLTDANLFVPWIFVQTTDEAITGASSISVDNTASGLVVDFSAMPQGGSLCDITWDFGDGSSATGADVTHTYATEGSYTVTVSGTYAGETITQTVTVNVSCALAVSVNAGATSATASSTGGTNVTYAWADANGNAIGTGSSISNLNESTTYSITATDASGCTDMATFTTASCAISISGYTIQGTSVTVLSSQISNGTSPYTYQWTNANTGGVLGNSSVINNINNGVLLQVVITDASGCSATYQELINVEQVGLEKLDNVAQVSLLPNPANNVLSINIQLENTHSNVALDIIDVTGKIVWSLPNAQRSAINETLDVSNFANGIYFVRLNVDGKTASDKIVVNH